MHLHQALLLGSQLEQPSYLNHYLEVHLHQALLLNGRLLERPLGVSLHGRQARPRRPG